MQNIERQLAIVLRKRGFKLKSEKPPGLTVGDDEPVAHWTPLIQKGALYSGIKKLDEGLKRLCLVTLPVLAEDDQGHLVVVAPGELVPSKKSEENE